MEVVASYPPNPLSRMEMGERHGSVRGHWEGEMHALLGDTQQLDLGAGAGECADDFLDQPFR